jgi:hypothetical protein
MSPHGQRARCAKRPHDDCSRLGNQFVFWSRRSSRGATEYFPSIVDLIWLKAGAEGRIIIIIKIGFLRLSRCGKIRSPHALRRHGRLFRQSRFSPLGG